MLASLESLLLGPENLKFCKENRLPMICQIADKACLRDWQIPIISVTGTNGKGSTIAALRSLYDAAGFRVGVFTSPHLMCVNERIALNNQFISDEDLQDALQAIVALDVEKQLSFFEKMTLAALYYFKKSQPDILLMEVGLGGRLDAINILDADVVVVTSVDLDHMEYLGNTIELIAAEKAGLFRAHRQAIFADGDIPSSMVDIAKHLKVSLKHYQHDYVVEDFGSMWAFRCKTIELQFPKKPRIHLPAMAAAIYATQLLDLPVLPHHIQAAVGSVFVPGRQQWVDDKVPILLDVAHNPHAVNLLKRSLLNIENCGKIHVVFSALKDKDCEQIVNIFNNLSPVWYTTLLDSERTHTCKSLNTVFENVGVAHQFFTKAQQAFASARQNAQVGDIIVVFGSFYLVGEIMQQLQLEGKNVFRNT